MTETLTPIQYGHIFGNVVDLTNLTPVVSTTVFGEPSGAVYRFQLGTGRFIASSATFNATLSSASGNEVFYLVVLTDPSLLPTLVSGALAANNIPSAFSTTYGTASSIELARETVTAAGAISFDLDLALLAEYMSHSLDYTDPWHGSLLLWLIAAQESFGEWSNPSIEAYETVTYANRDTGRSGPHWGSKSQRCPRTGLLVSRVNMVKDGWKEIYVHPLGYDPPEPEEEDFSEFEDPNED